MLLVTYHAIGTPASPVCLPPGQLRADLRGLQDAGFSFVSLDDCADWLAGRRPLPERAVAVTFDDAYMSVVSEGLPILKECGVPATVFAIGGRIGGDNQWSGQWKSIGTMPLADLGGLRELVAEGIGIGSHSWSHRILSGLADAALREEIEESGDRLEQLLHVPVRHFAYPYGIRGSREIAAARGRYRTAVNAEPKPVVSRSDPHDLNRVDGHDLRLFVALERAGIPAAAPYFALRRQLRGVRRRLDGWLGRL